MASSPHEQTINTLNSLASLMQQFNGILRTANQLINTYDQLNMGNITDALPTAALNSDGTLGTADGATNTGHPIDVRVITTLNFAATPFDYGTMLGIAQSFVQLMNGTAVTTQANAPAELAKTDAGS